MQEAHAFAGVNEQVHGGKVNKARVTILVTVSAAGEKLPLLCIGKSKNPRWPVVMGKKANSPVDYDSSKKGWMTEVVWAVAWLWGGLGGPRPPKIFTIY